MQYTEEDTKNFPNDFASETSLLANRRVVLSSSNLAYASATELDLGTLVVGTLATDKSGTVRLRNSEGTTIMIASGAITANTYVYAAANGKVAATGSVLVGLALTAATADLDQIEVIRLNSAGFGYVTGAGSTVSQLTDRTTGVTINALSGAITTQATSLAAAGEVTFTVTNSLVAVGDVIVANIRSGPTATTNTFVTVTTVAAGSFNLTLNNPHASTADTGAAIINFVVIKGVSA